jgi:predicted homoserine dehydrogenase-like protein
MTAAADATKLSMECALLANASGFRCHRRGMYGPPVPTERDAGPPAEEMLGDS